MAPLSMSVTLPQMPSMVPVVRRWIRVLLQDCPGVRDAELVLAELCGNAVRYGRGEITVSVEARDGWARLAVTDHGSAASPEVLGESAETDAIDAARGLLIVGNLAQRWGHDHESEGPNTLWAELTW